VEPGPPHASRDAGSCTGRRPLRSGCATPPGGARRTARRGDGRSRSARGIAGRSDSRLRGTGTACAGHIACTPPTAAVGERRPCRCRAAHRVLARDRLDLAADPTAPRTSLLKARVAQVTWILLRRAGNDLADPAAPVAAPGRTAVPVAPGAQARPAAAAADAQLSHLPAILAAVGRCAAVIAANAQRPAVRRPSLDPAGLAADLAAPPTARVGGPAPGALVRLIGVRTLLDRPRRTAHPTAANAVTINDLDHAS
jgi:hypothetical protein